MRYIWAGILLLLAALLTACPKPADKAADPLVSERPAAGQAATEAQAGTDRAKVEDDKAMGEITSQTEAALPEGWPDSLPVYPGATVKLGQRLGQAGKEMLHVQLNATAPAKDILAFYDEKAKAAGMAQTTQLNHDKGGTYSYETQTESFTVTANTMAEGTDVLLMYAFK